MSAATIVFAGCSDAVIDAVPDRDRALRCDAWEDAIAQAPTDAVVVLGVPMPTTIFAAQSIGRGLAQSQLVICVPETSVGAVRAALRTTPFVPLGVRVVAEEDEGGIATAVNEAVTRVRMARIYAEVETSRASARPTRSTHPKARAHELDDDAVRVRELQRCYEVYDAHRTEVSEAIVRHALRDPAIAALYASESPEKRAERQRQLQILQRSAILDGDWEPYLLYLRAQGNGYAALGLPFGIWARLMPPFRAAVLECARADGVDEDDLALIARGLGRLIDLGMVSISQGYLDAIAARRQEADQRARLLSSIVETSHDAIVSESVGGMITAWNAAAEKLLGYAAVRAVGSSIALILPEEALVAHRAAIEGLEAGEGRSFETVRRTVEGRHVPVLATLSPILDEHGALIGVSSILRDISAAKRAEAERERILDDLRRSNEDLEHFAYVASHDLQEPLRMVIAFLGLLEQRYADRLDDRARRYIENASSGARRMKVLINDLLEYARVDSRGQALTRCELDGVLDDVLRDLAGMIESTGATIHRAPLPVVRADRTQMGLVFRNLLSNSIKFRSLTAPEIHVAAEGAADVWTIGVRDNGVGFDGEHQARMFMMFQSLHDRAQYPGTGIGLAVTKRIVERHGGRIWAEPLSAGGSQFWFTLPTLRDEERDEDSQ
ncbi:MAG: ATP-binding protein [Sandaracinaceae bacterium]